MLLRRLKSALATKSSTTEVGDYIMFLIDKFSLTRNSKSVRRPHADPDLTDDPLMLILAWRGELRVYRQSSGYYAAYRKHGELFYVLITSPCHLRQLASTVCHIHLASGLVL